MAYGEKMKKLSPCSDAQVLSALREYCPAPGALLDAGCGRGERLAAAMAALPKTACCGIDLDPENAAEARARCPGAEIVTGDVCALPWMGGQFDAALCECTLSLLDAPERCLEELHRVLRPGGVLLLSDLTSGEADARRTRIASEGALRHLASVRWTEQAATAAGFRIMEFIDCREEFLTMAAQLLFDGGCGCIGPDAFAALRARKAGYGMWIMEKGGMK